MEHFILLTRLRIRIALNSIFNIKKDKKTGRTLLAFFAVLFVIGDYWFFRRIIIYLISLPDELADILIPQFLMVIFLTFFSMLVFSNIISSISTFYLSQDLDLLISSPVRSRDIFSSRIVQTTINSSSMFFIFGVPIFIALGTCYGAGADYYVGMALTIIPFIIVSAGIGIPVTVLLMRFFPARKTYQFLTIVGLIFMAGLVMFFRFMQPEKFLGKAVPEELIEQFVRNLEIPSYWFLPSTWAARSLVSGTDAAFSQMYFWISISWAAAILIIAVNIFIVSKFYYTGWTIAYIGRSGAQPGTQTESRFHRKFYGALERLFGFMLPSVRAIVLKDLKMFFRDPSQWTQLFMLAALVIIYVYNIRNLPMETVILKNFVSVLNIGLAGVVLAAVGVRFIFVTTSIEAKSFWLVKSAPVNFTKYLWGKFFFYLVPLLFLAETLVVLSNMFLAVDPFLTAISMGGIFFITIGLTGLGVGLGAVYPVFDFENIAEIGTSIGAIYYMLISLAYVGVMVMFGVRPIWVHLSMKFLSKDVGGADVYLFYAIILALTAAVTIVPMRMGAKSLRNIEV